MFEPTALPQLELTEHCCTVKGCGGTLRVLREIIGSGCNEGKVAFELVCCKRPDLHRYFQNPDMVPPGQQITKPHWGFPQQVVKVGPHPSTIVQ